MYLVEALLRVELSCQTGLGCRAVCREGRLSVLVDVKAWRGFDP